MRPSQACVDLVKRFEGLRLEAYLCPAGKPTIGYGHTGGVKLGDRVDQAAAEKLLAQDLAAFALYVNSAVRVGLEQNQFDALVTFAFNVKGWRTSTLLRLVNEGQLEAAAAEFQKWNHADGKVLAGLTSRRAAERELFEGQAA
jgi:lysozyme